MEAVWAWGLGRGCHSERRWMRRLHRLSLWARVLLVVKPVRAIVLLMPHRDPKSLLFRVRHNHSTPEVYRAEMEDPLVG